MEPGDLKILVACECSQTVCAAFRALGAEAYSCDLCEPYGARPDWHVKGDALELLETPEIIHTMDGAEHFIGKWDLIIAHPPCTYLSNAQSKMYNEARWGTARVEHRRFMRECAAWFFMQFAKTGVPTAIENPPGYMNRHYRKPSQTIQPYYFGDNAQKATCLWLYNGLPALEPTNRLPKPTARNFPSAKSMSAWYYETSKFHGLERARVRSKTFPGIAQAMASQWTAWLLGEKGKGEHL